MLQSMTAFARRQRKIALGELCWEVRSVNHRYLDASLRMPEQFRYLEPELRTLLRKRINRGKIECQLRFQDTNSDNQSILINKGMISALLDTGANLATELQLANDLSVRHILAWPGVIEAQTLNVDNIQHDVLELFNEALEDLVSFRAREGLALQELLNARIQQTAEAILEARAQIVSMSGQIKEKLLTRLEHVRMHVAEERIEQEIAVLLTRYDIAEELDRLDTHLHEVQRVIHKEAIAGRRLDFLIQELHREASTLSAKSDSVVLTQIAVTMKVLIEQMREQIQNIE